MIKSIIFDLDDTLCDYTGAARNAQVKLSGILHEHGIPVEGFWQKYCALEPLLFEQFVEHSITTNEFRIGRFEGVLQEYNQDPLELAVQLNRAYMNATTVEVALFEDVVPVLTQLAKQQVMCAILTNGPTDGQKLKFLSLGLDKYIKKLFISEEIGWAKPHCQAFQHVLNQLACKPDEALMVGDSLENDVSGANTAGISALLLDRWERYPEHQGPKIKDLFELLNYIVIEGEKVS